MMKVLDTQFLIRAYNWSISTIYRIVCCTLFVSLILIATAFLFSIVVSAILAGGIFFLLGFSAYSIRHSAMALNYPGIDRFFQQVPCYLTIQNRDMKIIRTNRLFRKDFGDRVGELCYRAYKGINHICPECPVIKTLSDGKTHSTEETVTTRDGKNAQMIVYTTPVFNELGKIIGVMEMSTNITKIKKLQEKIEASRKEFMDLFERVPCYISIQDKEFRIKRINQLFRQEFGDRTDEYCYRAYYNRDAICEDCHVQETLKDGKIHSSEKSILRQDGREARLIVYSSPLYNEKGELNAVMEIATDITEVKRLQRELTLMGKTIAAMAHRIKNILMGLEGGIFVVETGMEFGNEEKVNKGWGMIQRNVEKVSHIVKDLLYCSKEREMNYQNIDPTSVVRNVYELFEGRAQKEGIALNLNLPDSLPTGYFDPDALHTLLTNLVTNALDACLLDASENKDSHQITITGFCEEDGKYIFEVEDNGSGIPGAVGECLFEDFFSTKGREGTGLGLLVAHKVIEEHNGTITFTSKEGEGTKFRAIFPTTTTSS